MQNSLDCDVLIVGAGIAGTVVARELSKYKLKVILVEKQTEVGFGVTKATHSFIHCGLPEQNAPLLNRLVLTGNTIFDELTGDLDVPFERIGKLLLVMRESDLKILEEKKKQGDSARVPGLRIVKAKELKEMEPNLTNDVVAALYTPTTGLVSPWGLVIALAENALTNGVQIELDTKVMGIQLGSKHTLVVETNKGSITTRFVINAAGLFADEIAKMVGQDDFNMVPLKQERYILDEKISELVYHLVRSPITGDFVSPTKKELAPIRSNTILGFTAEKVKNKHDITTSRKGLQRVFGYAKKIVPSVSAQDVITSFAGLVPLNDRTADYIIEPFKKVPGFINVVLGGSGVTASPAVAYFVRDLLAKEGLEFIRKSDFNPQRSGIAEFREMPDTEKQVLMAQDPHYSHVVCRCETVTEGEIIEAIRRGARTVDGVKYRTRAGMGRCQGGFCGPRVVQILARELHIPVTQVTKKGQNSHLLFFENKQLLREELK